MFLYADNGIKFLIQIEWIARQHFPKVLENES